MHEATVHSVSPALQYLAGALFIIAYAVIASEKIHKTKVALVGATLMLLLRIVHQDVAFGEADVPSAVDWNTIFLLIGMMIIVAVMRRTGVYGWLAIKAAKLSQGRAMPMIFLFSGITALLSAMLDNVTTVLLIAPVTILIAETLGISPIPLLICEILASNIGGTATLVGDPPNIMIGSAADLGFMTFLVNLTPPVIIIFPAYVFTVKFMFEKDLTVPEEKRREIEELDEAKSITDWPLLKRSLLFLGLTFLGFMVHEYVHLEPATMALMGASLLLLFAQVKVEEVLREVEWPTIFFFIGLFVMVGGLEQVGIIRMLSQKTLDFSQGNFKMLAIIIMWFSAFASAIVDNIPFVATMNPLLIDMAHELQAQGVLVADAGMSILKTPPMLALWWSLALGACLGGNGTIIGASANVVVAGIAEQNGYPIHFMKYLRYGLPLMIESIVIAMIYVYFRYLVHL